MGIVLDNMNNFGIKITLVLFLKNRRPTVIFVSFVSRMVLIAIFFYLIFNGNPTRAAAVAVGIGLSKIFLLYKKLRESKNEHINR
jgi:hypothetical protein